jgi:arsenate reductase (thioredoxin)
MKIAYLIFVNLLISVSSFAQNKIVFVCEHGSAKSIIAATYFNKLAKDRNLPWVAVSRGTNPDSTISPKTKQLLSGEGLLDNKLVPQKVTQADIDDAQQVVLFWPLPESIKGKYKTYNWLEMQAVNNDYHKLRDDIVAKIIPLLDSLAKRQTY